MVTLPKNAKCGDEIDIDPDDIMLVTRIADAEIDGMDPDIEVIVFQATHARTRYVETFVLALGSEALDGLARLVAKKRGRP